MFLHYVFSSSVLEIISNHTVSLNKCQLCLVISKNIIYLFVSKLKLWFKKWYTKYLIWKSALQFCKEARKTIFIWGWSWSFQPTLLLSSTAAKNDGLLSLHFTYSCDHLQRFDQWYSECTYCSTLIQLSSEYGTLHLIFGF